ncbi:MAG: helix-turn-helix transcriptional regulator [Trueperaceae bacterium]
MIPFRMNGLTDRLFAMVDLLRGQKQLTTQALAEHFGVSERTIRRDLARLQDLEIEVETLPGRGGGVTLGRGSLLPALRFTDDEALVLALGLKQAQRTKTPKLAKAAESAFKRLEHVLSESLGERIDSVLQTLETETSEPLKLDKVESHTMLDVSQAVQHKERLEVRYRSHESGFTYRKLDPYGIVYLNNNWYVAGYCHLRKDVRTFRLDRLEILKTTGETFKPPKNFNAFKTISESLAQAPFPGSVPCRVLLQTNLVEASKYIPAYIATLEPVDDGVMLTVMAHPEWFWRVVVYLLELPYAVKVLEPTALKKAFEDLAKRAIELAKGNLV